MTPNAGHSSPSTPPTPASRRGRTIAAVVAIASLLLLASASAASAGSIVNPFFKADTWSSSASYNERDTVFYNGSTYYSLKRANSGNTPGSSPSDWALLQGGKTHPSTLDGWTSTGNETRQWCWTLSGDAALQCQAQDGQSVPVVGAAGSSPPPQGLTWGPAGMPGFDNWQIRMASDIYNDDAEWLADSPPGTNLDTQSNFAIVATGCTNGHPAPVTLSQQFTAEKDDVLSGYSFFSSNDWVPDSADVTVTPQGGSPEKVFGARIASDEGSDLVPHGSWDHPVPPTVHQQWDGRWVKPDWTPASIDWITAHDQGVSGVPWTKWTYRFPHDGTYTVTATASESTDPAFAQDCNMPSTLGVQFQTPTPIKGGLTIQTTPTTATYGDAPFSIADDAKVYDSKSLDTPNPVANPTGKGVQFSTDDPDCSVTPDGTVTVNQVGDGTCDVTVRAPGDFYSYAAESKTLPITINPAPLHVDAPNLSRSYGAANPDPADSYDPNSSLRGFVNGDDAGSAGVTGEPTCSVGPGQGADAGTYAGAVTCAPGDPHDGGLSAANYSMQAGNPGTLTITKANQSINLPGLANKTFGDGDVTPGAAASSGLPVSYASSTQGVCTITGDGKVHIVHAGTCTIVASQGGNQNYNPASPVNGSFTVAKADQTIAFGPLTDKNFGDGDFNVNATASSQLSVKYASSTPSACTVDPASGLVHITGGGDCVITVSQAGNGDYNPATDVTQRFHIATAGQNITFAAISDKTYGDQDLDPGATASSGLPVSYTAQGDCTIVGGKVHITGAGICTVTANQGGDQRYSSAPPVSRTFQVSKAPLTIKADDKSKTYGAANPSFTASISGLVSGDATSGAASCSSNAGQSSDAGSYGITCAQGTLEAGPNYELKFVDGTLTVNKAQLNVKADDQSKTYGAVDPSFTASITGFVNGDTQASATSGAPSCSSNAGQGVGNYPINCSQGNLTASNYTFNFSPGTLNVNKAQLNVKADDKSKTYGDPNPSLTATITGFVNGDTQGSATTGSASCSTSAGQGSSVGGYPITCAQGSLAASNYDLNFSPGTLNVNKANQSINLGPIDDKFFGQEDFNAGASDSAGLPVSYSASGACTVDPSTGKIHIQLPSQWPGNCTITASQGGNGNYNAAQSVSRSFQIATAALAGGGIFDIGNLDAAMGNNVNWWGSQWANQNHLTGGAAPDAFKGYIDNISSYPPQCGTTWTTRPGNSSKPPDSVPQYMTVVVSSDVNKSGSTISGDVQSVVVVKTNSGYDSNPGHWGTGTVVAKLCGQKLNQSVTFNQPSDKTATDADFDLGATSSSGLPVSYSSQTPSVCQIVDGKVDLTGAGDCTITASQNGNDVFNAASSVTRTFKVGAFDLIDCGSGDKKSKKKSGVECESVLVNPTPGASATVTAGQKMTIGYTDDSPIPTTGSLAPTAILNDGRSLPVSVTPTSGLPFNYVTSYKQDRNARYQSLLSFNLPSNLTSGSYTILVTANDGDGDVDQWSWPVRVN